MTGKSAHLYGEHSRGMVSKAQRIMELLREGVPPDAIVDRLGVHPSYIGVVQARYASGKPGKSTYDEKYQAAHVEKLREANRERVRRWREANPERAKELRRRQAKKEGA